VAKRTIKPLNRVSLTHWVYLQGDAAGSVTLLDRHCIGQGRSQHTDGRWRGVRQLALGQNCPNGRRYATLQSSRVAASKAIQTHCLLPLQSTNDPNLSICTLRRFFGLSTLATIAQSIPAAAHPALAIVDLARTAVCNLDICNFACHAEYDHCDSPLQTRSLGKDESPA
jgi:hypothetical protein